MARILLTGATGFIGSHLLEALLKEGHTAIVLKRSQSDTWRIRSLLERAITYDVDRIPLRNVFEHERVDYIFHLATCYRKADEGLDYQAMMNSNVTLPAELLETAVAYGAKGFINTGTFFEVDCQRQPVHEDTPVKAFNFYARTKIIFDALLRTYDGQIPSITLRMFTPYGARDNEKLVPMLIQKALAKERMELSEGFQKLDFIYVQDIVEAYLKALAKLERETATKHQVYHIGSGRPVSIREVVSVLEELLGAPLQKAWGPASAVDIPVAYASIDKARAELGWTPQFSLHQGLAATLRYYQEQCPNDH